MSIAREDPGKTRAPALAYVGPFLAFIFLLAIQRYIPLPPSAEYPLRLVTLSAVLFVCSRRVIDLRVQNAAGSCLLGIAVFAVWIAPDLLWPSYRQHWIFQNPLVGSLGIPVPENILTSPVVLWSRILRAAVLVPIIEELFWRAWMMRWLISPHFDRVKLGTYTPAAFWITALLFAAEHGPYWDVGLLAGIAYNWWMVRTRSLGDCILAHAVTNACLCAYVVVTHRWDYWL